MNKCENCGHSQSYHVNGAGECIYESNLANGDCNCGTFAPKPENSPDDQRDKKNVPDKDLTDQQDRPEKEPKNK